MPDHLARANSLSCSIASIFSCAPGTHRPMAPPPEEPKPSDPRVALGLGPLLYPPLLATARSFGGDWDPVRAGERRLSRRSFCAGSSQGTTHRRPADCEGWRPTRGKPTPSDERTRV